MVERMDPVNAVSAIADVPASVRRTGYIPDTDTGGITVKAARTNLLSMLNGSMRTGVFLNEATSEYPVPRPRCGGRGAPRPRETGWRACLGR
jgi:putative ABC transport system permease protein